MRRHPFTPLQVLFLLAATLLLVSCSGETTSALDSELFDVETGVPTDATTLDAAELQEDAGEVEEDLEPAYPEFVFSWENFAVPSRAYRPWVRWWWPGGDVTTDKLKLEVQDLVDHGFGGAEIQPFSAALDPAASQEELDRRLSFDSPGYYETLASVLEEAQRAGLDIDVTLGSGWSSGGMHIAVEDSVRTLVWSEEDVSGPKQVTLTFDQPDQPPFYQVSEMAAGFGEPLARYLPDQASLVAVLAARITGGERDSNPLVISDQVQLDASSVVVLTDAVDAQGTLVWSVPSGQWKVIAFYDMPDGEFVNLIAQPEPGFVVNHLDARRFSENMNHLLGDRTGLSTYFGAPLKGFFNDSFELKAERLWTDGFLEEFQTRRGYDLTPYLPAVVTPGADNNIFDGGGISAACPFALLEGDDARIRHDYAQTVSDLFIEDFVEQCTSFASQRGMTSRVQPYGVRIDVIRAAGAASIPETEQLYAGGSRLFSKVVSSGAHLYNRPVVSSESMVWSGRDFMLTPMKIKASADKLFADGVNRILYHGYPYSVDKPEIYGEQGWSAFSSPFSGMGTYSENVSKASPYWDWFTEWNGYLSRVQYALTQGLPDTDLLVYYPWLGITASLARMDDQEELLFNGALFDFEGGGSQNPLFAIVDTVFGPKNFGTAGDWLRSIRGLLGQLEGNGYSWDFINDHSLARMRAVDGRITVRGNRYSALLVVSATHMELESARQIEGLAAAGIPVVFVGDLPSRQPGLGNADVNDAAVQEALLRATQSDSTLRVPPESDVVAALEDLGVSPLVQWRTPPVTLQVVARDLGENRRLLFFWNPTRDSAVVEFELTQPCTQPVWIDPWTASAWTANSGQLTMRLPGLSTRMLACGLGSPEAPWAAGPIIPDALEEHHSLPSWTLSVQGDDVDTEDQTLTLELSQPESWLDIPELAFSSSTGTYETAVTLDNPPAGDSYLCLGWFAGMATVRVNGATQGMLFVPPGCLPLSDAWLSGENTVEIDYVPPLRNRLIGKGNQGEPQCVQFKNKDDSRVRTGLLGPISIRVSP